MPSDAIWFRSVASCPLAPTIITYFMFFLLFSPSLFRKKNFFPESVAKSCLPYGNRNASNAFDGNISALCSGSRSYFLGALAGAFGALTWAAPPVLISIVYYSSPLLSETPGLLAVCFGVGASVINFANKRSQKEISPIRSPLLPLNGRGGIGSMI